MSNPEGYVIDAKRVGDTLLAIKEALENFAGNEMSKSIAISLIKTAREDLLREARFIG